MRDRRFGGLRFPRPLEDRFETDVAPSRSRRLWVEGWLLLLAYGLTILGDHQSIPGRFHFSLLIRCCVVLPWLLVANELLRHNPRPIIREGSILITAGMVACSSFVIYANCSASISAGVQVGVLISLLVTNVVMRIRFPYAVLSTVFCIASDAAFLALDRQLTTPEKFNCAMPVVTGALFMLFAAYSLEREERLAYLLQFNTEIQSEQLAALNAELERLSAQDALTGLANRAAFDQRFELLWEQAAHQRGTLSAVVLDIDHFKIVNDTQGHLYGDEVIKRVAALLQQSLRGKNDFAARYGGEEFVLLLPNASRETAVIVAERIRSLIQLAGSPAPAEHVPDPGLWTTVSCGVATVTTPAVYSPRDLLHAADTALYRAKAEGRNRVCVAPQLGAPSVTNPGANASLTAGWGD